MSTPTIPKYSIIVPVYNSQHTLAELVLRIEQVMVAYPSYELLLIDDFSTDGSWQKLQEIKQGKVHIRLIRLTRNFGQAATTLCGINESRADVMITIDDDLQYPPEEIPQLIAHFNPEEKYLLFGVPQHRAGSFFAKLGSALVKAFINRFVLQHSKEIKFSTFRILTKKKHRKEVYNERSMRSVQIFFTMVSPQLMDYIYVKHEPRKSGKSNYSLAKRINIMADLLVTSSDVPLMFFVLLGVLFGCIGLFAVVGSLFFSAMKLPRPLSLGIVCLGFSMVFAGIVLLFTMLKKLYLYHSGAEAYAIWEEK